MADEITIDVSALFRALKKKAKFIALSSILCTACGGIYCILKTPVYESFASVRIQQPFGIKTSLKGEDDNSSSINPRMFTYTEIIKSRSVIEKVLEENNITDSDGKLLDYSDYIKNYLSTEMVRDTEILKISVKALDPGRAQRINGLIIERFLARLTELNRGQQQNTREFLEERVKISQRDLSTAENALNNFKRNNVIYTPDDKMARLSEQMILIDRLRAENTVNLESAREKNAVVSGQLAKNTVSLADNISLRDYRNKLAELEAQRIEYLEKYTEEHPLVKEITGEIEGIKKALDNEIKKVVNKETTSENENYRNLLRDKFESEAQAHVATNNLEVLDYLAEQYQSELAGLSDIERQYLKLTRDLNVAQEIYVMLSKNLEEARVAEASISNEVQVLDTPSLPVKASEPKATRIIPLALLIGLFFSCLAVIIKELANNTIRTAEEIHTLFRLPVLGSIPLEDDKSDAFITVATNLKHLLKDDSKIISIVSAANGEGRSTIAKNLGIALANENFKVVVVEGDSRNPTKIFGASNSIAEKISDAAEFIRETEFENLFAINGVASGNPAQILSNKIVAENFSMLKENFDLILIDTPPLLKYPDALILNEYADGLALVVEANKTDLKTVREMILQLEQVNANIIGVILNKAER